MHNLQQLKSGELSGTVHLKLSEELTKFPEAIFQLASTLEVLDLSGNYLKELPVHFGKFTKLRILFLSNNHFQELPAVLGDCPALDIVGFKANMIRIIHPAALNRNLRWLILTNNCIQHLPPEIGFCSRMQKLMLAGNQLTELPDELKHCSQLALLRISANRLKSLPAWLLTMPQLGWIALSGNPFATLPSFQPTNSIAWNNLQINKVLGEGASGIIYKAIWNTDEEVKEVAVKIFKGSVTSDGLPEDEMNTNILAGDHRGLVKLIGQISGHPDSKTGLVMELIPTRFSNLGITPSFESCTRDVFDENQRLSGSQILRIAHTIASVAAQLHSKGIMHGDLYAHNILADDEGNTLFGDFGAASFYDRNDIVVAEGLERIEIKAYGYLLDDLLHLSDSGPSVVLEQIEELKIQCLDEDVLARPGFDYAREVLEKLLFTLTAKPVRE